MKITVVSPVFKTGGTGDISNSSTFLKKSSTCNVQSPIQPMHLYTYFSINNNKKINDTKSTMHITAKIYPWANVIFNIRT